MKRLYGFLGLVMAAWLLAIPAWADCQSEGERAKQMMLTLKQQALNNQPLDQQAFMGQFNSVMNALQAQGCTNEIMGIAQYAQAEKQRVANPGASTSMPDANTFGF